jgi:Putative Actinobacterial Holin-X, holin superfamily III
MSVGQDRLTPQSATRGDVIAPVGAAANGQDWPAQATAQIVKTVDLVRTKTTEPAIHAARAVVYGLVIAFLAVTAATLACIMLIRFVDIWVPGPVYWAYLIVGGVVLIAGIVAWSQRNRKPAPDEA